MPVVVDARFLQKGQVFRDDDRLARRLKLLLHLGHLRLHPRLFARELIRLLLDLALEVRATRFKLDDRPRAHGLELLAQLLHLGG